MPKKNYIFFDLKKEREKERQKREREREKQKARERARKDRERQKRKAQQEKAKQKAKQARAKARKKGSLSADSPVTPGVTSLQDLKTIVQKLKAKTDRYVRQLVEKAVKSGIQSPALENLMSSGGRLTTTGDYEKLYGEYLRGKEFLDDETHTPAGYDKFLKDIVDVMQDEFGDEFDGMTEDEQADYTKMYWDAFEIVKKEFPYLFADKDFVSGLIASTEEYCIESKLSMEQMIEVIRSYCNDYVERHK